MKYSPDQYILWDNGTIHLTATVAFTWIVMAILIIMAIIIRMKISTGKKFSGLQNCLEVIVGAINDQVRDVLGADFKNKMPFIATLFLFILVSNVLGVIPGFIAPTSSLTTTACLAGFVFLSVPYYTIQKHGFFGYLKHFVQPVPIMLPLNIISEFSGSLALAVRLYGNIMSGTVIGIVLLGIVPFFFPVLMQLLGLITGVIQAYIFSMLALIYIVSATPED
jgi:F-type H+-transporting ATPase subunit a